MAMNYVGVETTVWSSAFSIDNTFNKKINKKVVI